MRYGMSLAGQIENAAKVAQKKAQITNSAADWRAAAAAWDKAENPGRADYCEQMAKMLEGMSK